MQLETKANDAQVLKTNVRIGRYTGWKPRDQQSIENKASKRALPPRSNNVSKLSTSDMISPSTQLSSLPKDIPNLIWNESTDMFKTSK